MDKTDRPWHSETAEQVLEKLGGTSQGLGAREAADRLVRYGPNTLPEKKPTSWAVLFLGQFNSALIYILIASAVAVYLMGETADAVIIAAVLVFNAIVGVIQEGRAQNTLRALRRFAETKATVLRDGSEIIVPDREVVPGDIVVLREGEKVPADLRVITTQNLTIDEASLTGESTPVHKISAPIHGHEISPAEQKNMAFKGTTIVAGHGTAVVVATGIATEIGKIAEEISEIDTEIPLKANIRNLSRAIIIAVVVISTVMFVAGIATGESARTMFGAAVSLAVSIIPEGLPVVITLVLATGVWRMSKRNALVKKLQAVEALGQARVIAVDKTGTITMNEMVVREVWTEGKTYEVGGTGYEPKGDISVDGTVVDAANHPEILYAAKSVALCADARLSYSEEGRRWQVAGDPTEAALLVFARKIGFRKEDLLNESPVAAEIPFDYRLKYRAAVHKAEGGNLMTVIGAPETLFDLSTMIRRGGKDKPMSADDRKEMEKTFDRMSRQGQRVIAVAARSHGSDELVQSAVTGLSFVGLVGMKDPLRLKVAEAMRRAAEAGIRVVMITGDHKITAQAIATEAGIFHDGDKVMTGDEIEKLAESDLPAEIAKVSVFARVTPEHKMRIVTAFKKRGEIIAMTGDGVNDAPSLVAADLGVAMGVIGTEVAKEAADIVLLDDNFGSIVSAVEEGRNIYKTIKKVILYLFSTSLGEVLTIVGALFIGLPLPLLASQIIWLNFVTDGFLTVAMAMEPKEEGLLSGTFERPKKYLVDKLMIERMIYMATPMMLGTLLLFNIYAADEIAKAWTISLTTLAVFQWFNAYNCRSEKKSVFASNPFSNIYLTGAMVLVVGLQFLAVYAPFMQKILHTVPLSLADWLIIIPVSMSIIVVEEIRKLFHRRNTA